MAPRGMKGFYIGLAVLAALGAGAIYLARGSGEARVGTVAPLPPGADTASAMPAYSLGSDSAPVQVDEYADFQCPYCGRFAILTMPDVVERLIKPGRVRWRFHDRPLEGHAKSLPAHEAAACAGEQGRFWEMHDQLYYHQNDWVEARNTGKTIREYASKIGLDLARYDDCISSHRYLPRLAASARQATERGITSTPTFVIGSLKVAYALPYDSLKALIDSVSRSRRS